LKYQNANMQVDKIQTAIQTSISFMDKKQK